MEGADRNILIDPYLSNGVEKEFGPNFKRMISIPIKVQDLPPIDFVLVSHAHHDHCDCETLAPLCRHQPQVKIIAPPSCQERLRGAKIPESNVSLLKQMDWLNLSSEVSVKPVPACHPRVEWSVEGVPEACGYLLRMKNLKIYHSGDTSPDAEIVKSVSPERPDWGFIPINERSQAKERAGIVGNMSCQEAVDFASALHLKSWIPIHWDMFENNSVNPLKLDNLQAKTPERRPYFWMKAGDQKLISAGGE